MTVRTLALLVLASLAACSAPSDAPTEQQSSRQRPVAPLPPEASGDVAREAGLTPLQGDALRDLGVPILLPRMGAEWTAGEMETETEYGTSYEILWRRDDGACLYLFGSNDGLGGPEYPIVSAEVTLSALPRSPRYRVYRAADDPGATSAENWGPGTVVSDYVEAGDMSVWLISSAQDGCRPLALEEGASVLASLRPLDPGTLEEDSAFGSFEEADDVLVDFLTDVPVSAAPEADVEAFLSGWEASEVFVETLGDTASGTTVLATLLGYADDSVEGERLLLTFVPVSGGWELQSARRQVRCYAGRGHTTWSPEPCL
ncbi:hypothetical protein [Rubricoccus marinus]|uniref:Lipoprotein n=1 Tax=Rubricoccus marinus TaxID=716817 RepID=A0A259TWN2_9BACT|nr:hypothetical protein [Rubricoccus marinus]OZC02131.1 hypothetical protein BSZ36_03500 [Rubricoccus marinus]